MYIYVFFFPAEYSGFYILVLTAYLRDMIIIWYDLSERIFTGTYSFKFKLLVDRSWPALTSEAL